MLRVMRAAAFAATLLATLCVVVPSAQSGPTAIDVTASKKKTGPFSDDAVSVSMSPGDTKTVWYRVKNKSGDDQGNLRFEAGMKATPEAFKLRWFRGKRNITKEVNHDNYRFALADDAAARFKAKITNTADGAMCFVGRAGKPALGMDSVFTEVNISCGG